MTFNSLRKYIGLFFRDVREEKLITHEEISKESKFTIKEIKAFESGKYFDYLLFIYYCEKFNIYNHVINLIYDLKSGRCRFGQIKD